MSVAALLAALNYPWDYDQPLSEQEWQRVRSFYGEAYSGGTASGTEPENPKYVQVAADAARVFRIEERVAGFVRQHNLADGRVLDVGAGRGYLQDLVEDYTGLDISSSAGRFFHKPYVRGSATAMPFQDDEFDAAWSIWVLEHVPNPEQALLEMRRVVKDGGYLYLGPAWDCEPWPAHGYEVRPYSDFDWRGKFEKATIPLQRAVGRIGKVAARGIRRMEWALFSGPTVLRYRKIEPNYEEYWQPDSDAINSLSRKEMAQWFISRGDDCLNCFIQRFEPGDPRALIIRVNKPEMRQTRGRSNPILRPHRVSIQP